MTNSARDAERWSLVGRMVLSGVVLLAIVAIGVSVAVAARQGATDRATHAATLNAKRNDCARVISVARQDVVSSVIVAKARADQIFYALILGSIDHPGERDPALVEALRAADVDLDARQSAAAALPPVNDVIDHGGWIAGVHYRACPTVP